MGTDELWRGWAERMRETREPAAIRDALSQVAAEVGAVLARERSLAREWAAIGLQVDGRPIAASGMCVRGTRRVLVRQSDPLTRRRYTVAHELAHLLVAQTTTVSGFILSHRQEERLCERFASLALIPRERLRLYVDRHPPQPRLQWLRLVAKHFRVSLSPLVIALGDVAADENGAAFLLAQVAAHSTRKRQVAVRIAHSACSAQLRLPRDKRLSSLGLRHLSDWAHHAPPGATLSEHAGEIELEAGSAAPTGTASYRGSAACEAVALAGKYRMVLALDTSQLTARRRPDRRRRACSTAVAEQMTLALS